MSAPVDMFVINDSRGLSAALVAVLEAGEFDRAFVTIGVEPDQLVLLGGKAPLPDTHWLLDVRPSSPAELAALEAESPLFHWRAGGTDGFGTVRSVIERARDVIASYDREILAACVTVLRPWDGEPVELPGVPRD